MSRERIVTLLHELEAVGVIALTEGDEAINEALDYELSDDESEGR